MGDQIVNPQAEVVPMFSLTDQPADRIGLVITGTGTSDTTERKRAYVLTPDEAEDIARRLTYAAEQVRSGQTD
jgi:hypothetical protein